MPSARASYRLARQRHLFIRVSSTQSPLPRSVAQKYATSTEYMCNGDTLLSTVDQRLTGGCIKSHSGSAIQKGRKSFPTPRTLPELRLHRIRSQSRQTETSEQGHRTSAVQKNLEGIEPRASTRGYKSTGRLQRGGRIPLGKVLRPNPFVRPGPSFRPDLHALAAAVRSGGQGGPLFAATA
jgi:hypothetical protein